MHHKYVVRDREAVWTGSANWTIDSWSRQENVLAIVEDAQLGERFAAQLRRALGEARRRAQRLRRARRRSTSAAPGSRAWFTPGHGEELSQRVATLIGGARERVRIASPVLTSGPVLATLNELAGRGRCDVAGVVDGPQVATVFEQWAENAHSAWKIPLLRATLTKLPFAAKPSTPWRPDGGVHDFMHAKLTVADDTVFLGSFNLSRSGEQNAENMLEVRDRRAGAAAWPPSWTQIRGRYPDAVAPPG